MAPTLKNRLEKEGFSLVLSGGAALGCAHLGVLEFLESQGLAPREMVGTSMGAIVGAAFACGYSCADIADCFDQFSQVTRWVGFSWKKPALLNTRRLSALFENLFQDRTLKDTRLPLKIGATDFETGALRVFTNQEEVLLRDALLCSMSIPVLFPPVTLDGRVYVDGFLSANLPVDQVTDSGIPIVAVDVLSERSLEPFSGRTSFWGKARSMLDAYERAFYLLVQNQTREAMARPAHLFCLKPSLADFKVYHFHKWQELKKRGFEEAQRFFEIAPS